MRQHNVWCVCLRVRVCARGLATHTHHTLLFSSKYFHYKIFIHVKCLEN